MIEACLSVLALSLSILSLTAAYYLIMDLRRPKIAVRNMTPNGLSPDVNYVPTLTPKPPAKKVPEIPPEVLAPSIINPPKMYGGFGSKVTDNTNG